MNLEFYSVNKQRWQDFETLFESKGAPHYCWCTLWRDVKKAGKIPGKLEKKESMHGYINHDIPVGILAYLDRQPIAWCSIAPRNSYRALDGFQTEKSVWSISCFFIKKEYRKMGIQNKLINQAIKYAKNNGADYIEAYPADADSPSYRFMGLKPTFEKVKFRFIKKAGKRRNVMLLDLSS